VCLIFLSSVWCQINFRPKAPSKYKDKLTLSPYKDCYNSPCRPTTDGCISCACTSDKAGYCQVMGGKCKSNFFSPGHLTPYEFDVDIELLSDDHKGSYDVCDVEPQPYIGLKHSFLMDKQHLTCSTADAFIPPKGPLIKLDGVTPVVVNVDRCTPDPINPGQCQLKYEYPPAPENYQSNSIVLKSLLPNNNINTPPSQFIGSQDNSQSEFRFDKKKREVDPEEEENESLDEEEESPSRVKRAFRSTTLAAATFTVGQSTLRSVPYRGGCPSSNMCIKRRRRGSGFRCCALIVLGYNGRLACPRFGC